MQRRMILVPLLAVIMLLGLGMVGCSDGDEPVTPPPADDLDFNDARKAVYDCSLAFQGGDVEASLELLADPERWQAAIENAQEDGSLEILAAALRRADEIEREEYVVTYRVTIAHPMRPGVRRGNYVYAVKDEDGNWGVEFAYPYYIPARDRSAEAAQKGREAQWDANSTHMLLSDYILRYYHAKYPEDTEFIPNILVHENWNAVKDGSRDEDFHETVPGIPTRGVHHYLSPHVQGIFNPSDLDFKPVSFVPNNLTSLEHALNNAIILGNDYSYPIAVSEMLGAVTASDREDAFYIFGHVLHLLEDAAVPAHVRNDPHSVPGTGGQDLFELWATKSKMGSSYSTFKQELDRIYSNIIKPGPRLERRDSGFTNNVLLDRFFDNPEDSNYRGIEALFEYTAVMTNHMCFSQDTIWTSVWKSSVDTGSFPELVSMSRNRTRFYGCPPQDVLQSLNQLQAADHNVEDYLIGFGTSFFDTWFYKYWDDHGYPPGISEIKANLADVRTTVTITTYEDKDRYGNNDNGVFETQFQLIFPLIVKTGAALLHEFYLDTHGGHLEDVTVDTQDITMTVWDCGSLEDGDQIDLIVNSEYILTNFVLSFTPYTFPVHLDEGVNTVVVHADNEGYAPPNTACLTISNVIGGQADQSWQMFQGTDQSFHITVVK